MRQFEPVALFIQPQYSYAACLVSGRLSLVHLIPQRTVRINGDEIVSFVICYQFGNYLVEWPDKLVTFAITILHFEQYNQIFSHLQFFTRLENGDKFYPISNEMKGVLGHNSAL